jgi:hypothetical protein
MRLEMSGLQLRREKGKEERVGRERKATAA